MMRTSPLVQLTSTGKGLASLVHNRVVVHFGKTLLVFTLLLLAFSANIQAQSLSVSMSSPAFRTSFLTGTPVNIQATTTTPASTTVTKVEFFLATFTGPGGSKETVKLGEDLTAPFSYTWTIPDGQISYNELSLKVTNSTGATAVQGGTGYNRVDVYAPNTASNKKYYVQAGANPGTAGTLAAPFNTIQKGVDVAAPGDSIFVMAGTYTNTAGSDVVIIRRTGTPTNWIVLTNYQNDKPKLMFNAYQGFNLVAGAAYIKIQGFEIVGNNANVTLPQATTQPGSCDNPTGTVNPAFNGNGISLSGRGGGNVRPHHVVLANNIIHDCGGAGISAIESDYVTVENNTVYNNSWYTIFGTSGISFLNSWNYDANTDTPKMIIRNNRSYGNRLYVKWIASGVCRGITDGNGIILDNNNNQFGTTNPIGAYTGKFLIENNICYQNGGRGINVNYSDNATVRNNTFYQNAASPEITSEFAMRYAASIRIYNNIFYTLSDKATGTPVNSPDLLQSNNLTFRGTDTPFFTGPQSLTGVDPQFVDAASGNFQLQPTSPAINAGSTMPGRYAAKDILGIDRPQGAGVDMGAYELPIAVPFAIAAVTTVSCSTVSAGLRSVRFTPQYAGANGHPLSFSVVNEMLPTSAPGPYTLNLYTDNPTITLKAVQEGTTGEVSFSYNWLAACNGDAFAITGVTTVSCSTVGTGVRSVRFTPQYTGLNGQPLSFSVVNELPATTSQGPYTLRLYTDNPTIVLKALQTNTPNEATFNYDWLAACANSGARTGADEPGSQLRVSVLGNPVREQLVIEIRGASGQPLQLCLTDSQGRTLESRLVEQGIAVEHHVFDLRQQSTGLLLLRVSTNHQVESVKVLKQ